MTVWTSCFCDFDRGYGHQYYPPGGTFAGWHTPQHPHRGSAEARNRPFTYAPTPYLDEIRSIWWTTKPADPKGTFLNAVDSPSKEVRRVTSRSDVAIPNQDSKVPNSNPNKNVGQGERQYGLGSFLDNTRFGSRTY
jgi:hypothetical protein